MGVTASLFSERTNKGIYKRDNNAIMMYSKGY